MSRRIVQRIVAVLALTWALLLWAPARSEAAGFAGSGWEMGSLWEQALSLWHGLWAKPVAETAKRPAGEKSTATPISPTSTSDVTVGDDSLEDTRLERGGAMDPNG